jgi:antitoxin component YwqK of YwqJK toxin-antitoxin module
MDQRVQLVLNNSSLTVEEKIKQLQGIMDPNKDKLVPAKWHLSETLWRVDVTGNNNHWCATGKPKDNGEFTRWQYTFVPQEDGTRMLDGDFIEYYPLSNQVKYRASYSHDVIEKSQTNYLGGNVHTQCYYTDDGTLDMEYHYPDDSVSYRLGQESKIVRTCNNPDDQGYIKQFEYITDDNGITEQVCVQYTHLERGFQHGVYSESFSDKSTKVVGSYHNGKMHGNWRGFYPNGQPQYYQDWDNGSMQYELTWNRNGHLTEKIQTDQDRYYDDEGVIMEKRTLLTNGNWLVTHFDHLSPITNQFEESSEGEVVRQIVGGSTKTISDMIKDIKFDCIKPIDKLDLIKCGHPSAEYASNRLSSMNHRDCIERRWDDNFNRALNYGVRTIVIDDGVPQTFLPEHLTHAKEYFGGYMVRPRVSMVFPNTFSVCVTVPEHVEYERTFSI